MREKWNKTEFRRTSEGQPVSIVSSACFFKFFLACNRKKVNFPHGIDFIIPCECTVKFLLLSDGMLFIIYCYLCKTEKLPKSFWWKYTVNCYTSIAYYYLTYASNANCTNKLPLNSLPTQRIFTVSSSSSKCFNFTEVTGEIAACRC